MGLDMYLFAKTTAQNSSSDIEPEPMEIGTWRKHRDLHRFIESKWAEENPELAQEREFNCVPFRLSKELVLEIRDRSMNRTLPLGDEGFFFGATTQEDHEDTIGLMTKALILMDEGYDIYYNSWW